METAGEDHWLFCSSQLTELLVEIAAQSESPLPTGRNMNQRIGMALRKMRLQKPPRSGGQGNRHWLITLPELKRWASAYGVPLPELFTD
jgi:hypothetical protein